jgi:glycerol-3-phosphate O-acyltransferase
MMKRKRKAQLYPHVFPNIKDWPIFKMHQDRDGFVREIDQFTIQRLEHNYQDRLSGLIAKTSYLEKIRIKEDPWKVDPPDDRQFWNRIQKNLIEKSLDTSEEEVRQNSLLLLNRIVHRYSEEIVGTFRINTFLFARRFLTFFFNRLLNTAASRNFKRIYNRKHRLYQRLIAVGEVEAIRSLMKKGTVVVVPTHFSNLDSILLGYVMDSVLGLPSFSYGAGLNLYNTGYTAYFMNRLGAYRVDRRKKNPIYLEVLKSMSTLSLQRGTNSLFFPGGTRSRSGELETRLKLGLLGTLVEAQRGLYQQDKDEKIFVVPVVLGYHTVLEARFLIDQHLRRTGKERYISSKDDFQSLRKIISFAWKTFSMSSEIMVSFGKPMDVLGNFVDEEGRSYDRFDRPVSVREYFMTGDQVVTDLQRESEYTRILSKRIIDRYFKDNYVLSSHLVAFVAFSILKFENPNLDLYGLLRLPTDEFTFDQPTFRKTVRLVQHKLQEMAAQEKVRISPAVEDTTEALITDGLKQLGVYHPSKPLKINKKGELISQDFKLLFFYHNRLEHYGLTRFIQEELYPDYQLNRTPEVEEIRD